MWAASHCCKLAMPPSIQSIGAAAQLNTAWNIRNRRASRISGPAAGCSKTRSSRRVNRSGAASRTTASRVASVVDTEHDAMARLAADVGSVLGEGHDVDVRVVRGDRRKALLDAAEGADLLVVDAPRSLASAPLFAHRLVYAAPCPVVVMPPRISGEPQTGLERAGWAAVRAAGSAGRPGLGTTRTDRGRG